MRPCSPAAALMLPIWTTLVGCVGEATPPDASRARPRFATAPARPWSRADDPRPDFVVITLCSVRPDHLGPWGHAGVSPTLDRLASAGTVFEHAWSNATFTLPAHASLLTGLVPSRAGVMESTDDLDTGIPTLPEALQAHGYRTVAWSTVSSATSFRRGDGLERGFASFLEGGRPRERQDYYDVLLAAASPYFTLVHFKNSHAPYRVRRDGDDPRILAWAFHDRVEASDPDATFALQVQADPVLAATLSARYDEAVAADDADIGALLAEMDARRLLEHAVVIVVGDHGDSLGEDAHVGHQRLTPVVTSVPLIVSVPPPMPSVQRVVSGASLVDVLPTVLGFAGATVPAGIDGHDLGPLIAGVEDPTRLVVAQALARVTTAPGQPQRYGGHEAIIRWPYWLGQDLGGGSATLLRMSGGAATAARFDDGAILEELLAARAQLAPVGTIPTEARLVSPEVREAIRQQGYW